MTHTIVHQPLPIVELDDIPGPNPFLEPDPVTRETAVLRLNARCRAWGKTMTVTGATRRGRDVLQRTKRTRYIVLPHLKPTLFFLAVIETTSSFQVFDLVYVMTQGGPAHASYSLVYMLYDQGFKYSDYGYAAAIGVALFVMTLVVALIQRRLIGRQK